MGDAKLQYDEVLRQSYAWENVTSRTVHVSTSGTEPIELRLPINV
jgi:hypothetical protein